MQANRCHLRTFLPQYMDYHLRYMVISMVARHPLYRHQNKVIFFPLVSLLLPLLEIQQRHQFCAILHQTIGVLQLFHCQDS